MDQEEKPVEEHKGQKPDADSGGYQLVADDTISNLDRVMEEAMAMVDQEEAAQGEAQERVVQERVAQERVAQERVAQERAAQKTTEEQIDPKTGEHDADVDLMDTKERAAAKLDFDTRDRIQRLENENETLRERLTRSVADFENFRKRTEREKESQQRFGLTNVLRDFLAVVDNLERAHAASGNAEDLKTGVAMIIRQYHELLARNGVKPVDAVGETFDPTRHEAVAREDGADVEAPTVTAELQKGYMLHDRLLRPAMVHVAMPAAKPPPPPAEGAAGEAETTAKEREESQAEAEKPVEASATAE